MTVKEYVSLGHQFTPEQAQIIGSELHSLAAKGASSTFHIVEAAQRKTSPLHPYFEWDDAAAGDKWRRHEAEKMARNIAVRVVGKDGAEHTMRAFLPVFIEVAGEQSRQRHYVPIEVVEQEPDYVEQVVEEGKRRLASWQHQYAEYRDFFGPVFPAIEEILVEEGVAA